MLIIPCCEGTRGTPQMRRRSYRRDHETIDSLPVVNRIAHPEPPETLAAPQHNLPDIAGSEPQRHADMAARKAEPLIEALCIDAGVVGQQLNQLAAPAARFAHRPLHQLLADALAAAMRGDANVLDQAARGALRAQPRQDAELQAADHRPALAFGDHEREVRIALDSFER